MNRFVTGFASAAVFALLGLAACGAEADIEGPGEGAGEASAAAPAGEGAAGEVGEVGQVGQVGEALAGASSCGAMIQSHIDWMTGQNHCLYGGYIEFDIVTHQASGLVSRAMGTLNGATQGFSFYNPITNTYVTSPGKLYSDQTADALQSFSDRTVLAKIQGETYNERFGFNPRAQDQVKVTFTSNGAMVFKLVSWGGGEITVQPTECMNGLMYGFGNGVLYSVALNHACMGG
jgi:hypothetical protein